MHMHIYIWLQPCIQWQLFLVHNSAGKQYEPYSLESNKYTENGTNDVHQSICVWHLFECVTTGSQNNKSNKKKYIINNIHLMLWSMISDHYRITDEHTAHCYGCARFQLAMPWKCNKPICTQQIQWTDIIKIIRDNCFLGRTAQVILMHCKFRLFYSVI